jgi:hypothetical protein
MNMGYRCKHFEIRELVSPAIHKARGDAAWELLNPAALRMLDALRDKFGPVTVNNWHTGGQYSESGLRDAGTSTGAAFSMHKFGGAFDCKFKDHTVQEVYQHIVARPQDFPEITTLENIQFTKTWLHFDVRNNDTPGIRIVNP